MFTAQFHFRNDLHGDLSLSTARVAGVAFLFLLASCSRFIPFGTTDQTPAGIQSSLEGQYSAERAMEDLRYFAQHWRIPGGPEYNACLSRIESDLRPWTTTSIDEHPLVRLQILEDSSSRKVWVPEDAELSMESPEVQVLHTYTATPVMLCENSFPADITAPLVYVPGGNYEDHYSQFEVNGRIVLCDAAASRSCRIAMSRGAAGVVSCYVPPYNRPAEHPDIIAESGIPYDFQRKPFAINISPRTADELKRRLRVGQIVVRIKVKTSFIDAPIRILQAEIPGKTRPEERVVLVTHLDHYKPGANDNASGSATLLEILRSTAASIQRRDIPPPARTMTFLWVDEYRGTGSWIKRNSGKLEKILAAFVLDMVGGDPEKTGGQFRVERMPDPGTVWMRPPDRHSGWGTGSWDKSKLFGSFLNDYYLSLVGSRSSSTGWKVTDNVWEGGSDHDPFLWRKVPAVLSWHFPDFAYHSSMDGIGNISLKELSHAGITIGRAAYQLALGTDDVARMALQSVDTAWSKRLETIKVLTTMEMGEIQSADASSREAVKQHEKQILDAWAVWYDEALESVLRISADQPSPDLVNEVRLRRDTLHNQVTSLKAALGL